MEIENQSTGNIDRKTVDGFGHEWAHYDQSGLGPVERDRIFHDYFSVFPWGSLPANPVGFDLGCGSGRWAEIVSKRVHKLHCIDASEVALSVARKNLGHRPNIIYHLSSVDAIPLEDDSADFGYSLGVLHHVPDTQAGIRSCVKVLKPGSPLLLYLYYAFDNKPFWFRILWGVSNWVRLLISRLPTSLKIAITTLIAAFVYFPLARLALLLEKLGFSVSSFPLSVYRNCSFYTMKTDALDRFGTRLEWRFTAAQIREMMLSAGLERIIFSKDPPYWCVVGYKTSNHS